MGATEWAMWANEQGVIASVVLIIGGILGTAAQFTRWYYGAYSLGLGVLVLLIEYPRGKRDKGKKTLERWHQTPFTKFIMFFGVFGRNYWVRFVFYILAAVPPFFFLSTVLGGASLFFTSLIYFRAAISGETWKPCLPDEKADKFANKATEPPKQPPPRGPRPQSMDNLAFDNTGV
ncbi:cytochrome b-245 light chain-like [Acropora millepora]|uniref:cytochrome b-245 light chain-like n=1 Tax=Acropora millepora TaxID=45264 RepID=UPI0010FCA123|nr:cytochrome b-245 light chain-like [Acropora millepora]